MPDTCPPRAWELLALAEHHEQLDAPARELGALGPTALPAIDEALTTPGAARQLAANALLYMPHRGALPRLLNLLRSADDQPMPVDPVLALRAALALLRPEDEPRVQTLLRKLARDPHPLMRAAVADALLHLHSNDQALLRRLAGDPDPLVRQRLADTALPQDPSASGEEADQERTLIARLTSQDEATRRAAVQALLDTPDALPRVLRWLASPGPLLRRVALDVAQQLQAAELHYAIASMLRTATLDSLDAVLALRALRKGGLLEPPAALPLLHHALTNKDVAIRAEIALWSLGIDHPDADRVWRTLIHDPEPFVRLATLHAWRSAPPARAQRLLPDIFTFLDNTLRLPLRHPDDVRAVHSALARIEDLAQAGAFLDARAATLVARVLATDQPALRDEAVRVLLTLRARQALTVDAAAYAPISAMLASYQPQDIHAALALLEAAHPATIDLHLDALVNRLYSLDPTCLAQAAHVLRRSHDPRARYALTQLQHHPEPVVRQAAGRRT